MSKISKIILSHLMRWIFLKRTKISDTESEQRKKIWSPGSWAWGRVAVQGGEKWVQDSCLVLASLCHEKRDCVAVISFIFLEEVILAVARTESSTFSLYRCSGVRAVGIWCSFNKQHSCCCRGRQASGYCSCSPSPSGISVQMDSLDCSMLPCSTFPFRSFFLNLVFLKIPK